MEWVGLAVDHGPWLEGRWSVSAHLNPWRQAEAELLAHGLSLPETDLAPPRRDADPFRYLRVAGKGFAWFGGRDEHPDELILTVKLPISAEMVAGLPFVRESSGWHKRNNWVTANFGPEDDVLAEMETLKAWLRQSYLAVAPRRLARQVASD